MNNDDAILLIRTIYTDYYTKNTDYYKKNSSISNYRDESLIGTRRFFIRFKFLARPFARLINYEKYLHTFEEDRRRYFPLDQYENKYISFLLFVLNHITRASHR